MKPIFMNLIFNRTPQKPKEEGIYFCIIKCVRKEIISYHYHFVAFIDEKFETPDIEPYDEIEVLAWAELEDPEQYFRVKMRIIS